MEPLTPPTLSDFTLASTSAGLAVRYAALLPFVFVHQVPP